MLEYNTNYNSFYIKNEKLSKRYMIFIIMSMIIILSIISFIILFKYSKKQIITGIVSDNKINLYLNNDELDILLHAKNISIDKKHYKIVSINVIESLIEQNVIYYNVLLEINSSNLVNNVILSLEISPAKEYLYKEIIRIMKGV